MTETQETPEASIQTSTTSEAPEPSSDPTTLTQAGATAAATQAEAYTPNYKYKVRDEELEFDEFLRGAIKTPEDEKRLRQLYEQSVGYEKVIKPKFDETTQKLSKFETTVNELTKHFNRGDLNSFLQTLGVPKDKLLDLFLQEAQYESQTPEERLKIDRAREAESRAHKMADENEKLTRQTQQVQQYMFDRDMELATGQADVKSFAEQFNARTGKADAFRQALKAEGTRAFYEENRNISPFEAVKRVMDHYKAFMSQTAPQAASPVLASPGNGKEPPVLPNLAGSKSSSPTQKRSRNLDDIRKAYEKLSQ